MDQPSLDALYDYFKGTNENKNNLLINDIDTDKPEDTENRETNVDNNLPLIDREIVTAIKELKNNKGSR